MSNFQTVRCPNCGNEVMTKYCPYCGERVAEPTQPQYQQPQYQQPQYQQPQQPQQPQYQQPQQPQYQQPQYQQPQYQQPQYQQANFAAPKKKLWLIPVIVAAVAICLVYLALIIGFLFSEFDSIFGTDISAPFTSEDSSRSQYPGGVSDYELSQLEEGMSYARISSIIGGDGGLVNQGEDIKGNPTYVFAWAFENDTERLLYVTFTNDKAIDITTNY